MPKFKETVLSRFWKRVIETPDLPSVLIKNPKKAADVIPVVTPVGAHVAYVQPLPYVPLSWGECGRRVAEIAAFLRDAGFKKGDRAAILGWNCPEWVWTDMAIQTLGGISVPIYPNSGPDQVAYLLKDSGASFIFASDDAQMSKVSADNAIGRVVFEETKLSSVTPLSVILAQGKAGRELAALKSGLADTASPFCGVTHDDPATFIYTSGSTGQPKGVILTHGNFAEECAAITRHGLKMDGSDVYLSYLPLAHVFERTIGAGMCAWHGIPVAFCKVEEMADALKQVQPTVLVGVPAVWRKFKDKIQGQLDSATGVKAKLIAWAFRQTKPGFKRWLADLLVFRKIRAGLGGRLRILMTGGAPISPDILNFFNSVGLTLLQGYGLTETTAGLSVNSPEHNKVGSVGRVLDTVEVKIVPEEGAADKESGEIWVRGTTVFKGYWNLEAETKKSITNDGWFKTGDLGRIDADGYLYITGRKKRLLKTDGGKYVAPEKIEKALDGDAYVQYIVPVGDGKPFISALVFVNELNARELLKKDGITLSAATTVAAEYETQPEVRKRIDAAVSAAIAAGNKKLEQWETVKKFRVVPVEATVANGLLTATLKIRTEEVLKRHAALVEDLYRK